MYRHLVYIILKVLPWKFCNMKWKNCVKVITKAEGLILSTTNFNVTDVSSSAGTATLSLCSGVSIGMKLNNGS